VGHYVRVLSTSTGCVPLTALRSALHAKKLHAALSAEGDAPDHWDRLVLSHRDGREIASIERNPVYPGSLGSEELTELADDVSGCLPTSAVRWLLDYFRRVRCIYALQVLSRVNHEGGWEIFGAVKDRIWAFAPSILQADNEGFSNEDGYHILWQFSDSVDCLWWMGVLHGGQWKHFRMDLGNRRHREAFFQGDVPEGVELAG
jgi:hypothetical protein